MKFVSKVLVAVLWILYRYSGLESLVDWVDNKVFVYRKRLQMVPTSFKLFVWLLGLAIGISGSMVYYEAPDLVHEITKASEPLVFVNPAHAAFVKEEIVEVVPEPVDLVDVIFQKESSRGKNNYSKCEAIGKYNRYGFGIPGNGQFVCFEKDEDTKAVAGWVAHRKALGWSDNEILCFYNSGTRSNSCDYIN